jgi:predicted nucleotidyltransferase
MGYHDMDAYRSSWSAREAAEREMNRERNADAMQKLLAAVPVLTERFSGIKKIVLFGSLAEVFFRRDSDIDLFIADLSGEEYYEAKRTLEDITRLDVDLYYQNDRVEWIERIERKGKIIYKRKN